MSSQPLNTFVTAAAVNARNTVIPGPNPSFLMVDDNDVLYRSRDATVVQQSTEVYGTANQIAASSVGLSTTLALANPVTTPGPANVTGALHVTGTITTDSASDAALSALTGGATFARGFASQYLVVGSSSPPTNTTAGDLSSKRLFVSDSFAAHNDSSTHKQVEVTPVIVYSGTANGSYDVISALPEMTGSGDASGSSFNAIRIGWTIRKSNDISGTISSGYFGQNYFDSFGTVNNNTGLFVRASNYSNGVTGSITTNRGIHINSPSNEANSTVLGFQYVGLEVAPFTPPAGRYQHLAAIKINGMNNAADPVGNAGIHFNSNTNAPGHGIVWGLSKDTSLTRAAAGILDTNDFRIRRVFTTGSAPSFVAESAAGSGAVISASTGTESSGRIVLVTGSSGVGVGDIFTVNYPSSWAFGAVNDSTRIQLTPAHANSVSAAGLTAYVRLQNYFNFVVTVTSALATSTEYRWNYLITC